MRFSYHSDLLAQCPELVAGVIWANGLTNQTLSDAGNRILESSEALTKVRFDALPEVAKFDSISAWRGIYSRFGVTPNRYPCAAESLIRRVVEAGSLPRINTVVDVCNAASLAHGVPVAPFDLAAARSDWIVRFASGTETFLPIGAEQPTPVPEGEIIYVDDAGHALSRRWNWRQADDGKITLQTTSVLITTEAVHAAARRAVEGVLANLREWLPSLLGGSISTEILDTDHPSSEHTVD